jgi:hypothetical protein
MGGDRMLLGEDLLYAFVLKWGRGDMVGGLQPRVRGAGESGSRWVRSPGANFDVL